MMNDAVEVISSDESKPGVLIGVGDSKGGWVEFEEKKFVAPFYMKPTSLCDKECCPEVSLCFQNCLL